MISKSLLDTEILARNFSDLLLAKIKEATIVRLMGDLGSGKTTFVKAIVKSLGGNESDVTSPTFVIMKSYPLRRGPWKKLIHIDAYRLDTPEDAEKLRLSEVFSDLNNLVLIEWPEKIAPYLPQKTTTVSFTFIDENTRKIEVQ